MVIPPNGWLIEGRIASLVSSESIARELPAFNKSAWVIEALTPPLTDTVLSSVGIQVALLLALHHRGVGGVVCLIKKLHLKVVHEVLNRSVSNTRMEARPVHFFADLGGLTDYNRLLRETLSLRDSSL